MKRAKVLHENCIKIHFTSLFCSLKLKVYLRCYEIHGHKYNFISKQGNSFQQVFQLNSLMFVVLSTKKKLGHMCHWLLHTGYSGSKHKAQKHYWKTFSSICETWNLWKLKIIKFSALGIFCNEFNFFLEMLCRKLNWDWQ